MDPEDRPAPSAAHEFLSGGEMTLFEHLNELRSRLFKAALGIALGFILGLVFSGPLFDFLIQPYCEVPAELRAPTSVFDTDSCRLVNTRVLGAFLVVVKTAGIVAAVVGGPVFFYQLWRFITPGLRPVERRYAIPFIALSQFLFLGGAAFAYWIIPRGLKVLLGIGGPNMVALLDASEYVGFLLKTLIGFGLSFEAPLIIAMLTLAGVVDATSLRKYRRHAIFGAFVLAAFITPTTDPFTMLAMAAPLVLFYEGNIIFARIIHRRRARAATA
jgi:sec-independent protein translocase protein TatC